MKISKTVFVFSLGLLLLGSTAFASWPFGGGTNETGGGSGTEQRSSERGMRGQGIRGNMELPDGWDDMTQEERRMYMEENKPEGAEARSREGQEGRGMRGGNMELPDGWDDMTQEERRVYREENRLEREENTGQQNSVQKCARNYVRKAIKGKNYKEFSGQLREKKQFKDSGSIRNQEAVDFLQQRGILDGYADGSFGPGNSINRAESLKVLLESLGEAPDTDIDLDFDDVPEDAWFAGYVQKAKRKGIVKGYDDGTFKPGNTVNQVELLKLAFESFGIDLSDYSVISLPEGIDMGSWFASYLQYAIDNDLLDIDTVAPAEGMTREMFAELIYRLIQQQEEL